MAHGKNLIDEYLKIILVRDKNLVDWYLKIILILDGFSFVFVWYYAKLHPLSALKGGKCLHIGLNCDHSIDS